MKFIISLFLIGALNSTPPPNTSAFDSNQTSTTTSEKEYLFISLERTPCLGRCPSYRISIYNTGRVLYEGYTFVEREGNFETQLDQSELEQLKKVMEQIDIFTLKDKYDSYKTDIPSCILHLNDGEQSKKIYDRDGAPLSLMNFEKLIDKIVLSKEFTKLKKSE